MCLYVPVVTLVFFIRDDSLLLGLLLLLLLVNALPVIGKPSLHGLETSTLCPFAFPSSNNNPLFQQATLIPSGPTWTFSQQQFTSTSSVSDSLS
jgi:hypothetical protein